ncbi:MFS transporter [Pseudomonas sp. LRF_L74]|uniref:MFS transporter n=1 Tax=Pseudomonas sp. LRF_L74 TaxID=3369422 RepID=UPI003F5D9276
MQTTIKAPASTDSSPAFDIEALVDKQPMGRLQYLVLIVCSLVIFIDGFDVQLITYIAPVLTEEWGIKRELLGPVFASGLVGTMLGAFLFGPAADRFGRKRVLLACVALFAVCSLATAFASSVNELYAWRFIGGLGLGGATPISIALASEYCPRRTRSALVMTMYCGFSLGAASAALLTSAMAPRFGWESLFILGGVIPALLFLVIVLCMPESFVSLVRLGQQRLLDRVVRRLALTPPAGDAQYIYGGKTERGSSIRNLFAPGRAVKTFTLWVMFLSNILSLYFLVAWFPTLVRNAGVEMHAAMVSSSLIQVGSIVGTLSLALFVRKTHPFYLLACGYLGGALILSILGNVELTSTLLPVLAFLAGLFVIGTQTAANALAALVYPPQMRSTGISWALGVGRIGSFSGPAIGGLLVAMQVSIGHMFLLAAIPAAIAFCAALTMVRLGGADAGEQGEVVPQP